jgi:hypothetical protein
MKKEDNFIRTYYCPFPRMSGSDSIIYIQGRKQIYVGKYWKLFPVSKNRCSNCRGLCFGVIDLDNVFAMEEDQHLTA